VFNDSLCRLWKEHVYLYIGMQPNGVRHVLLQRQTYNLVRYFEEYN